MIDLLRDDFVFILLALIAIGSVVFVVKTVVSLFQPRINLMAVSAAAQAIVDELNATAAQIPQLTGAAAQASEDLGAIKTAADGLSSAVTAALPPVVTEPAAQ